MTFDVSNWLQMRGFGQYADLFATHQIDAEALTALTEEHLSEMGIPLGPRLNLLSALTRISAPSPARSPTGERRRLTVMFVDLVGSTELSDRLDPEDLGHLIRGYQDIVGQVVARFEAHVAQYLGDGVMVYFGYPKAHEDDAERAVRSALAILRDVGGACLPGGEVLGVRIGIATGLVVVGDSFGRGKAREHAVGQTPNLASRLQAIAKPHEIVVSDRTRELIGASFELLSLGKQQLKGIAVPVDAYAVTGESVFESRFEARTSRPSAMIGRDGELALLLDRWRLASAGEGQVLLLMGEAGIGKSRLLRALQESLAAEPPLVLHHQCSPYHTDSALYPTIQQLTRAAQIRVGDSVDTRLDRLEALLAGAVPADMALIAALLGIDGTSRYGPLDLTPQQHRLGTFDALANQLVRVAGDQPVLWILEDAHWIDPTTLELVQRSIDPMGQVRVLAVVTARPDFVHDFGAHKTLTKMELNRLGRTAITDMVSGVTRGKPLPGKLMAEIVTKSDGVPLFVEEFTKAILESGSVRETVDAFVFDGIPSSILVPASLHDSLMARLDRLEPYKEIAQTASCIGREFGQELLSRICEPAQRQILPGALERLVDAELISRRSGTQDAQYAFKHALVRDTAYESLLRKKRKEIHGRLVAALEQAPDTAPEIIAQHAAQAHMNEKAILYLQKAANAELARPAYTEAIAHLKQAISLADGMGEDSAWQERRLSLWMALGRATIPLYGYSHSQTVSIFKHARELATAIGKGPRFSILYATWSAHYVRGEQDKAIEAANSMLKGALSDANEGQRLSALRSLGISQMITGELGRAVDTFGQAYRLAEVLRQRSSERRIAVADRFAADPDIATQFHFCLTIWSLGRIDEARALAAEALAAARSIGHAHTLAHALTHAAIFAVVGRDVERALMFSDETIEFANRHDMELWRGYGSILHGYALALKGELDESVRFMEKGFASILITQTGAMVPLHHAMHCRTLAALGRFDDAEHYARLVRDELSSGSERFLWPECRRLLGDYLCLCPGTDRSEIRAAYTGALDLAGQQGARSWQLYAATSLARFWVEDGEPQKAVELLAPLCAAFTHGRDAPGYREAAGLMEALARQ